VRSGLLDLVSDIGEISDRAPQPIQAGDAAQRSSSVIGQQEVKNAITPA
jgi:hypothetical protein